MTEPFDEYGERLRRVLHAEAETVTPSPEGLEQIRTKIAERADRRFMAWLTAPWIRPLMAVAAAVCITVVTVSAAPALKTFVQTGHFNSDARHDGGSTSIDGRYTGGTEIPPGSGRTGPEAPPHPIATSSATPGSHDMTGHRCPPSERPTGRSNTGPAASATPTPHRACSLEPTTRTSPTEVATPPTTSQPPQPPATDPASNGGDGGVQPSAQSSP